MRLDHMKEEFPQMPEAVRQRVETEVARQLSAAGQKVEKVRPAGAGGSFGSAQVLKRAQSRPGGAYAAGKADNLGDARALGRAGGRPDDRIGGAQNRAAADDRIGGAQVSGAAGVSLRRRGRHSWRTAWAVIGIAAAACTTVFAASQLGLHLSSEKTGSYGTQVSVTQDTENGGTVPEEIPEVTIQASSLPDGMEVYDNGLKIKKTTAEEYDGGISMSVTVMDLEENASDAVLTLYNTADSRQLTVGSHEAVLVEMLNSYSGEISQRRLIILFPEYWRVLQLYAAQDISEEELLAVAESITLEPTGENVDLSNVRTWSDEADPETELAEAGKTVMTAEDMEKLHQVGESFDIGAHIFAEDADGNTVDEPEISLCVVSAEVSDSLNLLGDWQNSTLVPDSFREQADENGILQPSEIRFIKKGNGVETINTVVKTETAEQKLLYLTLEYTNNGDEALSDILFYATPAALSENEDGLLTFFDPYASEEGDWDETAQSSPADNLSEMQYYDVSGGENTNGSNYISSLAPGETATLHLAYLVNENVLRYLYLDPVGSCGAGEVSELTFSESALAVGFVDIRQQTEETE